MSEYWSRRTLLASAALAAGGCVSSAPAALLLPPPAPANLRAESVIVVGAGLAGLACAYRLMTRGQNVLLLEASERAGGRICTLRQPWRDGLFVEAGASHLVPDPALLALLEELQLPLASRPAERQLARVRLVA